ncbi:protein TIC 20-v, chloroplastic-like [Ananas comosus]|uniref:Protein TIC 20 n=1 Tax=Ananas comosus TaxID=4615 RepID=A0A6P5F510_ANACO|nr:protein TIC 20-v, chloroplastic-like [Ananas comosus]XP_020091070.1 protein TIC 20-v, chloroplastic-like [Ananas comosus]
MQAIVLDVLLIFPDLLQRSFAPSDGVSYEILQSADSSVFCFFLLVSLVYGSTACLLGQFPRLPLVANAADRQVTIFGIPRFRFGDLGGIGKVD